MLLKKEHIDGSLIWYSSNKKDMKSIILGDYALMAESYEELPEELAILQLEIMHIDLASLEA